MHQLCLLTVHYGCLRWEWVAMQERKRDLKRCYAVGAQRLRLSRASAEVCFDAGWAGQYEQEELNESEARWRGVGLRDWLWSMLTRPLFDRLSSSAFMVEIESLCVMDASGSTLHLQVNILHMLLGRADLVQYVTVSQRSKPWINAGASCVTHTTEICIRELSIHEICAGVYICICLYLHVCVCVCALQ
jgi:hypothetical protein